ncbi:hypothetical protein CUJ84_pRLN3000178 (plasmid) [Rhizobium leguminosarum]|uniref:SDR family NAD(P)-dependent oxidoreductase n=1 Tax=Rhizobium leguminosarum TaxID=384 RepID=A0A2K9ZGG1_RHILE|nr:hypothetical protein CUJ84_pRLN3000178 [Rhizobium leguminosarum]
MKQQLGRVVVITGAAGGIGRALVDLFATGGDTVVAVDLPDSGVLEMARHLDGGQFTNEHKEILT